AMAENPQKGQRAAVFGGFGGAHLGLWHFHRLGFRRSFHVAMVSHFPARLIRRAMTPTSRQFATALCESRHPPAGPESLLPCVRPAFARPDPRRRCRG